MKADFKPIKKIIIKKLNKEDKKGAIKEFQTVADDLHKMFGWHKKQTYIYALASKFKKPRDLYDLAKSEVYDRGFRGNRAYNYLLGILKVKTR